MSGTGQATWDPAAVIKRTLDHCATVLKHDQPRLQAIADAQVAVDEFEAAYNALQKALVGRLEATETPEGFVRIVTLVPKEMHGQILQICSIGKFGYEDLGEFLREALRKNIVECLRRP